MHFLKLYLEELSFIGIILTSKFLWIKCMTENKELLTVLFFKKHLPRFMIKQVTCWNGGKIYQTGIIITSCFLEYLHFKDLFICTKMKHIPHGKENVDDDFESTNEKWEEGMGW